jgi:ketosteroid isomerase-like protein
MRNTLLIGFLSLFFLLGCATVKEANVAKESVETVQQAYSCFEQGDFQSFLDMMTADCEVVLPGSPPSVPWAGTYHGPEEYIEFATILSENVEILKSERLEFIAQGDKVVVPFHEQKRVKKNGHIFEFDGIAVWTVRNGKIAGMRFHADTLRIAEGLRGD